MAKIKLGKFNQTSTYNYVLESNGLIETINNPRAIDGLVLHSATKNSSRAFPLSESHVYVGRLKSAILVKRKYFLTSEGYFLAEGLTHSDYFIAWEGLDDTGLGRGGELVQRNLPVPLEEGPIYKVQEPCIFIGGDTIARPNFAHWIFEHLLKFQALKLAGVDLKLPVVVSDRIPKYFLEWAEVILGQNIKWAQVDLSGYMKFQDAIFCSCPAYRTSRGAQPTIWTKGFDYMASRFISYGLARVPAKLWKDDRPIFISRQGSQWRKAENEEKLFEMARDIVGARRVVMAGLTLPEQIATIFASNLAILFAGADGVITNFSNPRSRVVEVAAPRHAALYSAPVFCAVRGVRFTRMVGSQSVGLRLGPHELDRNYIVNETSFRTVLEQVR